MKIILNLTGLLVLHADLITAIPFLLVDLATARVLSHTLHHITPTLRLLHRLPEVLVCGGHPHLVCRLLFRILQDPLLSFGALEGARVGEWHRWVIDVEGGDYATQGKDGGENMCPQRMYWCLLLWHLIMF